MQSEGVHVVLSKFGSSSVVSTLPSAKALVRKDSTVPLVPDAAGCNRTRVLRSSAGESRRLATFVATFLRRSASQPGNSAPVGGAVRRPHDHVLLANLLRMNDYRGGWKAAVTNLWSEHLHAATMVGRMASARVAVELGYGIVPDDGPSGKLGHWAIAGVPDAVMDVHSKRAAEIEAEMQRTGNESYRARNVPAPATRA